jgi:FAD/FMN-containing dehydrogenase
MLVYEWDRAAESMRAARELMAGAPEELGVCSVLLTAPPEFPGVACGDRAAVISVAWCGDLEHGERVLAPLRAACPPVVDLVAPMPYVALQSMLDQTAPHGLNYYDKLHYLEAVSDELIAALVAGMDTVPSPQTHVITGWMGGAIDRVAPGATAFGHRGVGAETWFIGCSGEEPIGPVTEWVRRVWDDTAGLALPGTYVNALDAGSSASDAYGAEIWERLVAIKRRYDPDGVFTGNGVG